MSQSATAPVAARSLPALLNRRVSWLAMVAIVVLALVVGVRAEAPPTNQQRAQNLAETIRCPECSGQSVANSDATIAGEIRADLARRVDAGETDEQIYDHYGTKWGDDVLLRPAGGGLTGLVWALPVVVIAAATAGLALFFASGRNRMTTSAATPADHAAVAAARAAPAGDAEGADAIGVVATEPPAPDPSGAAPGA